MTVRRSEVERARCAALFEPHFRQRLRRAVQWTAAAVFAFAVAGCGAGTDTDKESGTPKRGNTDDSGQTTAVDSVRFTEDAIVFVPREVREVTVEVSPPGEYAVRFTLLGDPRDAFFEESEVWSNGDGVATAVLTAPSEPATFTVRASVAGTISAEVPASAAAIIGSVRVMPSYAGTRDVSTWVASVTTGRRCSELTRNPPPDGSLLAEAPVGESPTIDYVPIGTPIAVTVRAGHFAGGCTDAVASLPEPLMNDVKIQVVDRPLQLDTTDMPVVLDVKDAPEWRTALDTLSADVTTAFIGDSLTDVHALLDAMQQENSTSEAAMAFSVARTNGSWDYLLKNTLGYTRAVEGLRTLIRTWISQGLDALPDTSLFDGHVETDATGAATFELYSVAGSAPTQMGISPYTAATWTADPDDTVRMGTKLSWTPSLLLAGLAYEPAVAAVSEATDVPDALAVAYSCADVATALTANVDYAFGTCDVTCVTTLCERALRTMWTRAASASLEPVNMEIAAAGPADPIDDEARPLGFDGAWVGTTLLSSGAEVRFDGVATAGVPLTSLSTPQ